MLNEMMWVLLVLVLLIAVIVLLIINLRQSKDAVKSMSDTLNTLVNSPIWMRLATAAADNVPQDFFVKAYSKTDAVQAFVGEQTVLGRLIQSGEDILKLIDHDPTNDPAGPGQTSGGEKSSVQLGGGFLAKG